MPAVALATFEAIYDGEPITITKGERVTVCTTDTLNGYANTC